VPRSPMCRYHLCAEITYVPRSPLHMIGYTHDWLYACYTVSMMLLPLWYYISPLPFARKRKRKPLHPSDEAMLGRFKFIHVMRDGRDIAFRCKSPSRPPSMPKQCQPILRSVPTFSFHAQTVPTNLPSTSFLRRTSRMGPSAGTMVDPRRSSGGLLTSGASGT
jgi:hypothetical protein